jgi:hypothetical protein
LRQDQTIEHSLSFERAINLFKDWGFRVEPGPEADEVTLWIDAADHRVCCVYPAELLPEIASISLQVRAKQSTRAVTPRPIDKCEWQNLDSPVIRSFNR